jgi:hypothetical protein
MSTSREACTPLLREEKLAGVVFSIDGFVLLQHEQPSSELLDRHRLEIQSMMPSDDTFFGEHLTVLTWEDAHEFLTALGSSSRSPSISRSLRIVERRSAKVSAVSPSLNARRS